MPARSPWWPLPRPARPPLFRGGRLVGPVPSGDKLLVRAVVEHAGIRARECQRRLTAVLPLHHVWRRPVRVAQFDHLALPARLVQVSALYHDPVANLRAHAVFLPSLDRVAGPADEARAPTARGLAI